MPHNSHNTYHIAIKAIKLYFQPRKEGWNLITIIIRAVVLLGLSWGNIENRSNKTGEW